MSELYSKHAVKYDQVIQANIYNAMYDFPTMKKLIGEVKGKDIIDLGFTPTTLFSSKQGK